MREQPYYDSSEVILNYIKLNWQYAKFWLISVAVSIQNHIFQVLPGTTDGISWMPDVPDLGKMCWFSSKAERKSGVKIRTGFRSTVFGQ